MLTKYQDKLIGSGVTLLAALVAFYFGSFASKAQVDQTNLRINRIEKDMEKHYAKKADVQVLNNELQHLKTGQKEIKSDIKLLLNKLNKVN